MEHMKILKRAWHITWKYRALWWVGLLLVLAGGGLGSGLGSGSPGSSSSWRKGAPQGGMPFDVPQTMPDPSQMLAKIAPILVLIAIAFLLLILVMVVICIVKTVVRYVTRSSLVQMVHSYEETGETIGFRGGMRMGWSKSAWRLFLADLMVWVPFGLLIAALMIPLGLLGFSSFAAGEPRAGLGILFVLAMIAISLLGVAVAAVLKLVLEITQRTIVLEDRGPWDGFKASVALIRRHLGPTALQWLLLIGLRIAWGIVLIPVNLVLVFMGFLVGGLPALFIGGITTFAADWPLGLALGALVFVPVFIFVIALPNLALNTLATVFVSTTWTLTYRELSALDRGIVDTVPEGALDA
jgi:hypothetical protein